MILDRLQEFICKSYTDNELKIKELLKLYDWRVLYPGQIVTMEYNPKRINILVNKQGIIDSISQN